MCVCVKEISSYIIVGFFFRNFHFKIVKRDSSRLEESNVDINIRTLCNDK